MHASMFAGGHHPSTHFSECISVAKTNLVVKRTGNWGKEQTPALPFPSYGIWASGFTFPGYGDDQGKDTHKPFSSVTSQSY